MPALGSTSNRPHLFHKVRTGNTIGYFFKYNRIPRNEDSLINGFNEMSICECYNCDNAAIFMEHPIEFVELLNTSWNEAEMLTRDQQNNIIENILNRNINPGLCIFHAHTLRMRNIDHWIIKLYPINDENIHFTENRETVLTDSSNMNNNNNTNRNAIRAPNCRTQ